MCSEKILKRLKIIFQIPITSTSSAAPTTAFQLHTSSIIPSTTTVRSATLDVNDVQIKELMTTEAPTFTTKLATSSTFKLLTSQSTASTTTLTSKVKATSEILTTTTPTSKVKTTSEAFTATTKVREFTPWESTKEKDFRTQATTTEVPLSTKYIATEVATDEITTAVYPSSTKNTAIEVPIYSTTATTKDDFRIDRTTTEVTSATGKSAQIQQKVKFISK